MELVEVPRYMSTHHLHISAISRLSICITIACLKFQPLLARGFWLEEEMMIVKGKKVPLAMANNVGGVLRNKSSVTGVFFFFCSAKLGDLYK